MTFILSFFYRTLTRKVLRQVAQVDECIVRTRVQAAEVNPFGCVLIAAWAQTFCGDQFAPQHEFGGLETTIALLFNPLTATTDMPLKKG
jgi:hypothetical protein